MKTAFLRSAPLLLAAALAACASGGGNKVKPAAGGVDVARFHLGEPVARAQIAIEPFDKADGNRPEFPAYAAAVGRQLTRLGWTVVPTTRQCEQIALIDLEQGSREAVAALSAAIASRLPCSRSMRAICSDWVVEGTTVQPSRLSWRETAAA